VRKRTNARPAETQSHSRKYLENISALSVADMRTILRSGRRGNRSLRMIIRKSDWRSRSWISSRIICVVRLSILHHEKKTHTHKIITNKKYINTMELPNSVHSNFPL